MTYTEAMAYLSSLHAGGIRPGLARMEQAMACSGNEQRHLRVIHVAGTNGKGSVSRMIQCILSAAGYRTGLYASPAVTGLCDTITVDGVPISQDTLASLVNDRKKQQAQLTEPLSEFELVTALTLSYFAHERVEVCILECGMGGRLDATNICPPPLAAVFTPIARDHTTFLGDTVEAIALEKSGIMKAPCRVITSPGQSPEALAVLYEQAARQGLTVRQPNRAAATNVKQTVGAVRFSYAGESYSVPLGGDFQVDNALTALETMAALADAGFTVDTAACRAGLAAATLPCRQEVVCRAPLTVLDGAHNPHAVEALAQTIRQETDGAPLTLLIGMLRDKDTATCAGLLAPLAAHVICCTPPSERALNAAVLAAQFQAAGAPDVRVETDPPRALALAKTLAGENPLLVGGSFYLSGTIRSLFL